MNKKFLRGSVISILLLVVTISVFPFPHKGDIYQLKQPDGSFVTVRVWGDEHYQDIEGLDGYTLLRDPETRWICYALLSGDRNEFVSTGIVYSLYVPDSDIELEYTSIENDMDSTAKFPFAKHLRINSKSKEKKAKETYQLMNDNAISDEPDKSLDDGIQPTEVVTRDNLISLQSDFSEVRSLTGTIRGLTVLIDFPDLRTTISRSQVDNFCNQTGYSENGNNGSVKDWFYDISKNSLIYENSVTNFITVSNIKSYYDADCEYCRVAELVHEALYQLKNSGFDFSGLSTTNGYFTAINVLYYGFPEQGWARGLWPHSGWLDGSFTVDGISARRYQLTNLGTGFDLQIGTFIHENGHMVCNWEDLYAYDDHDYGLGYWDAGRNNGNPAIPNPYFLHLLGWIDVINLNQVQPGTIYTLAANSPTTCMYTGGNNERFYIETRRLSGRNAGLPGEGLTIWHVYTDGSNMYSFYTNLVSLEQADGRFDLEYSVNPGDSYDTFKAGYNDRFNDYTSPNAHWYTGASSGFDINTISAVSDQMSFTFGIGDPQTPVPTPVPTPAIIQGDVNGDGNVDIVDALLIAQCYVGLNSCPQVSIADVNCDTLINIVDSLLISQYYVGLITGFC